jgi:hypothetical protein
VNVQSAHTHEIHPSKREEEDAVRVPKLICFRATDVGFTKAQASERPRMSALAPGGPPSVLPRKQLLKPDATPRSTSQLDAGITTL